MVEKIQKRLTEEDISFSDVSEYGNGKVNVLIDMGDWKHDHLYCDVIMKELGYELSLVTDTEENGSDCYSAIRTYSPKSN